MQVATRSGERDLEPGASKATVRALGLSGGGVLGALQAGFLRGLFRTGYQPSMIVGTSAGAVNAAFLASHPDADGADELTRDLRMRRRSENLRRLVTSITVARSTGA